MIRRGVFQTVNYGKFDMRKFYYRLWPLLFFAFILGLPVLYCLLGPFLDTENYENRSMTAFPAPDLNKLDQYPSQFEAFFNDALPFRNYFVRANSAISYYGFHESVNKDVILGNEDWLFYTGDVGASRRMYLGQKKYSKKELKKIADHLTRTEKYLADRGCEFILAVAPNKDRLYQEYMPPYYGSYQRCSTDQLADYLEKKTDIKVLWLEDALEEYKNRYPDELLYYKTDTHWNLLGGYIGARAILGELGIDIPDAAFIEKKTFSGSPADLAGLLNLKRELAGADISYSLEAYPPASMEILEEGEVFYRYKNSGKDSRKLMLWRDSFADSVRYVIAPEFDESCMVRGTYLTLDIIEQEKPDIFVMLIAERSLDYLKDFLLEEK